MKSSVNKCFAGLLLVVGLMLTLAGCQARKKPVVVQPVEPAIEEPAPSTWHTAELWPIQANLIFSGGQIISANCKAQCVRDSLTILSGLMPILGVEILRLEARPDSVFAIDRARRLIAADSYAHLSEMLGEPVSLRVVEVIATGEILPEGQRTYEVEAMGMKLNLLYPAIKRDGTIRLKQIDHTPFKPCTFYDLLY